MKWHVIRRDFVMHTNVFYLIPTIKLIINELCYLHDNFAIEVHWLFWSARILWLREEIDG